MNAKKFLISVSVMLCTLVATNKIGYCDSQREFEYSDMKFKILNNETVELIEIVDDKSEVIIPKFIKDKEENKYRVVSIGKEAFHNKSLISIKMPNSITTIGDNAFKDCENLTEAIIGNKVNLIGERAFYNTNLISINIPDSVITIDKEAFMNCDNLTEVVMGKKIKSIGKNAFSNSNLRNIHIPDETVSIEEGAFKNCNNLTEVIVGKNVEVIEEEVFYDTTALEELVFTGINPPLIFNNALNNLKDIKIYLPINLSNKVKWDNILVNYNKYKKYYINLDKIKLHINN